MLPLPHGVAMCLYCGFLPVFNEVAVTAKAHTWEKAHPTLYRSTRSIQDLQSPLERSAWNRTVAAPS